MRIAALAKQIPKFEEMELGPDGRLRRDGLELHMNDYCRRGVAKGVELAQLTGGSCTVITLGPPSADTVCREALLCGADEAVHITDPAFAGSDTLATARALAAALDVLGPFDLVLAGRNSLDADTGQVPPQLAELLGLPFVTGVRELHVDGETLRLRLEHDDEWVDAEVTLPALASCAERLCDPCKFKDSAAWQQADGARIRRLGAADLGVGPWGQAGSPTTVGDTRTLEVERDHVIVTGALDEQVDQAVDRLIDRGALVPGPVAAEDVAVPENPDPAETPRTVVLVEPARLQETRELLGAAAELGGTVWACGPSPGDPSTLAAWGADGVLELDGSEVEEDIAHAFAGWAAANRPWAVLAPGTAWGREVASRIAARCGAGLTGDAIGLRVDGDRLVAHKPAFGGRLVADIACSSPMQMATVRAGVLPVRAPRQAKPPVVETLAVPGRSRLRVLGRARDDNRDELANADIVIGVGMGVPPDDYELLDSYAARLGATLCATRKVTDRGWLPRARQVGITGHTIAPRLYIAIGISGKFNHTVGVRSAGTIVAINPDPDALIFEWADVGFVGDWAAVLDALVARLECYSLGAAGTSTITLGNDAT